MSQPHVSQAHHIAFTGERGRNPSERRSLEDVRQRVRERCRIDGFFFPVKAVRVKASAAVQM